MANFPTGLDSLTNPSGADKLDSPDHPSQHATANDILEAVEAKVGIDSSAVATSHDYLIRNLPEQEGTLKLANATALVGRNSGDTAYINLVQISSANDMDLGGTGIGTIFPLNPVTFLDTVKLNANELFLDAANTTSITADTGNQIDIKINSVDDFKFTANTFAALSGSKITTNTVDETSGGSGVTIEGVLLKDNDVIINNNESYQAKQAGGSAKDLIKLGTNDVLRLSQIEVQENTTNSTVEDVMIQTGWGFADGAASNVLLKDVTLSTALDEEETFSIIVTPLGYTSSTVTKISDFQSSNHKVNIRALVRVSGTNVIGFTAQLHQDDDANFSASVDYGFSWIVIGRKA